MVTTSTTVDVHKEKSITVLEIIGTPTFNGQPSKRSDSLNAYWETEVLWCDPDTTLFLIGLEDEGEPSPVHKDTIVIEELSPRFIEKGTYARTFTEEGKIAFKKVA